MDVAIHSIKSALRKQNAAGVALTQSASVSDVYAQVGSLAAAKFPLPLPLADDWAMISYVQTNSALAIRGMPEWVAADVDQVLDQLVQTRVLLTRAVWFDTLGIRQHEEWPALATFHCIAVPVICVPPTRTIEYSRYQIPDRWDADSFDFCTRLENLIRLCSQCGPKCPLEFDSRLLNIAAALRTWPVNEAIMASSAKGAFVSFATLDRLHYTISWYQLILQVSLELRGYGADLKTRSIELYGPPLFQPCSTCITLAQQLLYAKQSNTNCKLLDDALAQLVMQANRFTLPAAVSQCEGEELWELEGLYKSPGEGTLWHKSNAQRLKLLQRTSLSQSALKQIAANICRGRPSLSSCYRQGDKWLTAIILSNLNSFSTRLNLQTGSFSTSLRAEIHRLLTQTDQPYGDFCYEDCSLETDANRCFRSPPCSGVADVTCLFNHLSGLLPPVSARQFLSDRKYSPEEIAAIMKASRESLFRIILTRGIASMSYEFKNGAAREYALEVCGSCFNPDTAYGVARKRVVLIGWEARSHNPVSTATTKLVRTLDYGIVYSYITLDGDTSSHIRSRGIFCYENSITCCRCKAEFIRTDVEGCSDLLEIHIGRRLPLAPSLQMVMGVLATSHSSS